MLRSITSIKYSSLRAMLVLVAAAIFMASGLDSVLLAGAAEQDLVITASFSGSKSISSREEIAFNLSRPLDSAEGTIAVIIGRTDVSNLLVARGNALVYTPKVLPLPAGGNEVSVYLVSPDRSWKQIATFTLRVEDALKNQASSQNEAPVTAQQVNGASSQSAASGNGAGLRWGFDRAAVTPSLTIGMKSQAAESHFPDSNRPPRPTFADATLQGSIRSDLARGPFNSQTQFDVVGSSFDQEALRFAQQGADAPRIDLSSYLMQFQVGKTKFNVGHIAIGSNRHLINGFSSRGLSLTLPITSRADFSLAAMNGTSIVGWSNFFGLERRKHQIASATFGFEFLPERPSGLRLEVSSLDGRLLPISSFNQGSITDAERGRGIGLRLLASDQAQRWRLDGGFARSRFTNPADPLLYQGRDVVPVKAVTRNARYLDVSYSLLQNFSLSDTKTANLTVNYRHERVDPLFRSVAAFTQADLAQNQIEAVAQFGDVTATVSHLRFNDNLRDVPSILKSLSRRTNVILGTPLASLLGQSAEPPAWLPRISYSFDMTHQFASAIPVNGGFELNLSAVPDQVSTNQNINADWQWGRARFGYRFNRSFQDNRQTGRERADLRNLVNGLTFGINPSTSLDLSFDLNAESALNKEMRRTDTTLRLGTNINWRITNDMAVAALVSATGAGATGGAVSSRSAELDLQWSYRWALEKSRYRKAQGQFFVRYANRYARSLDRVFGFNSLLKIQTLNAGLSFTFF